MHNRKGEKDGTHKTVTNDNLSHLSHPAIPHQLSSSYKIRYSTTVFSVPALPMLIPTHTFSPNLKSSMQILAIHKVVDEEDLQYREF